MRGIVFGYLGGSVFILIGIQLIMSGTKKEDMKSTLLKINYIPAKNYGKVYFVFLGLICIIGGLSLFFMKKQ